MFLPLVVAVLALIGTFAFFGAVNLVAEIDARGKDAAKFDSVRFHTHYNDRVFIKVKPNFNQSIRLTITLLCFIMDEKST